ncbi:MAG: PGF-pre-PGF domain-containing protein [Candidatus Aenigmatarchaeota archaeon]
MARKRKGRAKRQISPVAWIAILIALIALILIFMAGTAYIVAQMPGTGVPTVEVGCPGYTTKAACEANPDCEWEYSGFTITGQPTGSCSEKPPTYQEVPTEQKNTGAVAAGVKSTTIMARPDLHGIRSIDLTLNKGSVNIAITVNNLGLQKPAGADTPAEAVYSYIDIDFQGVDNIGMPITDDTVTSNVMHFSVSKTWVTNNNIDITTIKMQRWAGNQWNELPTVREGAQDTATDYAFKATSPGLSDYVITGEEEAAGPVCGNDICEEGEDSTTCPADCPIVPVCGNDILEAGETSATCCLDAGCPTGQTCVNNTCVEGVAPVCGNEILEANETSDTCCLDAGCPTGQTCVDNVCVEEEANVTAAVAVCGNGVLEAGETSDTCCEDAGCPSGEQCIAGECVAVAVGPTADDANQAIADAATQITLAKQEGKDTTEAENILHNAVNYFNTGDYANAITLADQAKQAITEAAVVTKPAVEIPVELIIVVVVVVLAAGTAFITLRGKKAPAAKGAAKRPQAKK